MNEDSEARLETGCVGSTPESCFSISQTARSHLTNEIRGGVL